MSSRCLLASVVSGEKLAVNLIEDLLPMMSCFSLAVFKILSLSKSFHSLAVICLGALHSFFDDLIQSQDGKCQLFIDDSQIDTSNPDFRTPDLYILKSTCCLHLNHYLKLNMVKWKS